MSLNTRFSITPTSNLDFTTNTSQQEIECKQTTMDHKNSNIDVVEAYQFHPTISSGYYQSGNKAVALSDTVIDNTNDVIPVAPKPFKLKAMTTGYENCLRRTIF